MANWLITREAVKRATKITGDALDFQVDAVIQAVADELHGRPSSLLHTSFFPITEIRKYTWPQQIGIGRSDTLFLDADGHVGDLVALTALTKDDTAVTAIATSDVILAPAGGPPYYKIEIDQSSAAFFSFKNTPQEAVRATGRWGYSENTLAAGNLDGSLSAGAVSMAVTDGSKINVGQMLLIETETVFVSERTDADMGINTHGSTGAMTADKTDATLTLASAPTDAVTVGEVLRIASERMRVTAINTTSSFEVERSHDGTTLAAHSTGDDVFIFRTFTVERAINGTTDALHADNTAITKYDPPSDLQRYALAEVVSRIAQEQAAYGRTIGGGEGAVEWRGPMLSGMRKGIAARYRHATIGAA